MIIQLKKLILIILIIIPTLIYSQSKERDSIKLFYLGGQSNMDGYGKISDLPDSLKSEFDNVWIFHGNPAGDGSKNGGVGKWENLQPGHGAGFHSNGIKNKLSKRFGVELSMAKKLQELYPNEKIAFIKYSKGGTSIDSLATREFGCWEPDYRGANGINQYDHFLKTIKNAYSVSDIDGDGKTDVLVPTGIIWMQGESDAALTEDIAKRYYSNLKRLMDLVRASLHTDDLPVVIGKISDSWNDEDGKVWNYCELVQYAQEKYVKTDENAEIVRSTRYYKYSDTWHYDSDSFIDLGEKFADEIFKLNSKK